MKSEFRKVALELHATSEVNHIKLAGVFSRLRNWVRSIFNKNHAEDVLTFQDANMELQTAAHSLISLLTELDSAIENYDLLGYSQKLSQLKSKVDHIYTLLSKTKQESVRLTNQIKEEIKSPEIKNTEVEKTETSSLKEPLKTEPKIMTLDSQEGKVFGNSFFSTISPDFKNMRFVGEGLKVALNFFEQEGIKVPKSHEAVFQKIVFQGIYNGTIINHTADSKTKNTRLDVQGLFDFSPLGVKEKWHFKAQCRVDEQGILHVQGLKKNSVRMAASNVLIEVRGDDADANVEFAKVVSASLNHNWKIVSTLYFNDKNVQINTNCDSSSDIEFACREVRTAFNNKFAGVKVYYFISENLEPSYNKLTVTAENKSFRSFRLKNLNKMEK